MKSIDELLDILKEMVDEIHLLEELSKKHIPIPPIRGKDNDYYCAKCNNKITTALKIYDGHRYMTEHPDHLKPVYKWPYCKCCGQAVKWDD